MLDAYAKYMSTLKEEVETPLPKVSPNSPDTVDLDNKPIDVETPDIVVDVSGVKAPEVVEQQEIWTPTSIQGELQAILVRLDHIETLADNRLSGYVGQEDFGNFVAKTILGLVNIIGHVVKLFYTGLFHGWRDFKRSELHAYVDSNAATMQVLYRCDYNILRNTNCDLPRGMKGTYRQGIEVLTKYLSTIGMYDRAKQFENMIGNIFDSVVFNKTPMSRYVNAINRDLVPRELEDNFKEVNKIFTDSSRDKAKFSEVFDSMSDFKEVITRTLDADSYLREVASVHDRLMKINDIVNELVTKHSDKITAAHVKDLVNIIRTIANCFETYSVVVNDLSRFNHNLTLVVKRLRTAAHL